MAYLTNTSVNGDLGVSGLTSVGTAGIKFTSGIINIFGTTNSGGTGSNSISIGNGATGSGAGSISIGKSSAASGSNDITIGYGAGATEGYSIAIGNGAKANKSDSIAIGYGASTNKNGTYSIAIGYNANASGKCSIALGPYNPNNPSSIVTASGSNSIAIGSYNTKATNTYSVALGYNAQATAQYAVAIGPGSTSTAANTMVLGNNSYTSTIRLLSSSGTTVTSDARDKINIEPLKDSLSFINSLRPVTYNLNDRTAYAINDDEIDTESDDYKKYIIEKDNFNLETPYYDKEEYKNGTKAHKRNLVGLLAQDVVDSVLEYYGSEDYINLVNRDSYNSGRDIKSSNDSSYDKLYMNYTSFIPILIKAIQEQDEKIRSLEDKISLLLEEKK